MEIDKLVAPYSPWIHPAGGAPWDSLLPSFQRPVFKDLLEDLESISQIISVTGPRRVGKSTLLQQIIKYLLNERKIAPSKIVYYSMDDPSRFRRSEDGGDIIDALMTESCRRGVVGDPVYLFLDEIQTLSRWEQYLKKYYDLRYPVKVVISGSASSPIFKKSRESLLGRVKDYHVLPFSFAEYLLYHLETEKDLELAGEARKIMEVGQRLKGMIAKKPEHLDMSSVDIPTPTEALWGKARSAFDRYLLEGGFPEVWKLPSSEKKIEYLFDNQVKKVIYEDLVLAAEFRKPEQLKTFYISLLEQPGREVNLSKLSAEANINSQQLDKYLPLLEMTDLIAHIGKFRSSPLKVRRGNIKCYLVDLALRNAVLRIADELLQDDSALGLYAENLVFNALKQWKGLLAIDFYREGGKEVDFIAHIQPRQYMAVEVKYRRHFSESVLDGINRFSANHACRFSLLITRELNDFGKLQKAFQIPLVLFLMLMG